MRFWISKIAADATNVTSTRKIHKFMKSIVTFCSADKCAKPNLANILLHSISKPMLGYTHLKPTFYSARATCVFGTSPCADPEGLGMCINPIAGDAIPIALPALTALAPITWDIQKGCF